MWTQFASEAKSRYKKSTIVRSNSGAGESGKPSGRSKTRGGIHPLPVPARAALFGLSRLVPKTAASLAEVMFLTPMRAKPPWREEWWATEAQELTLKDHLGRPLAAWKWGSSGPTVLLVHGWGGRGLQMGAFAEPLVAQGFQVVTFDAPSHGRNKGSRTSLPDVAGAVRAVLESIAGVEGIIAHSFGAAAVTLALDARRREHLPTPNRLVFVAPAGSFDALKAHMVNMTGFTPEVVGRMQRRIESRYGMRWRDVEPLALAPEQDQLLRVFHDEDDLELPWSHSRELVERWPSAVFHLTQGLGHQRILRDDKVIAESVAFLASGEGH